MSDEICPPHFFIAAWRTEAEGVLYCRYCGDVREMTPQTIGAPVEESVKSKGTQEK